MDRQFPRLVIRRDKLRNNFTQIVSRCRACGINVAGVIKGVGGLPEIARLYKECGAAQLATSRLEQIELWHREGVDGPFLLLRVPGMSELESRWVSSFISLSAARSSAASGTATVRLAPAISSSFCPAARSAASS